MAWHLMKQFQRVIKGTKVIAVSRKAEDAYPTDAPGPCS